MILSSMIQTPRLSLGRYILILSTLAAAIIAIETFNRDDEFESAIYINVCSIKNGGYGPGRVLWRTRNAQCTDQKTMKALCYIFTPRGSGPRTEAEVNFVCAPPLNFCAPKTRTPPLLAQDAGCVRIPKSQGGTKGSADIDDIACSSSVSFKAAIFAISQIKIDMPIYTDSITECSVERADNGRHVSTLEPCSGQSSVSLEANVPYHACIQTDSKLHSVSVGFKWFLTLASQKRKRGLDGEEEGDEAEEGEFPAFEVWHNETEGKGNRPRPQIELRIGNRTELI